MRRSACFIIDTSIFVSISFLIYSAKEIIRSCFVEISKFEQNSGGNIVFTGFIFGITGLGHSQHLGNLLLGQIMIFPQIADSTVHRITSPQDYHTAFCCIDKYRKMR